MKQKETDNGQLIMHGMIHAGVVKKIKCLRVNVGKSAPVNFHPVKLSCSWQEVMDPPFVTDAKFYLHQCFYSTSNEDN